MDTALLTRFLLKVFDGLFTLLCLMGWSYQIYCLITLYLDYNLAAEVAIEASENFTVPDTSICFRYTDILTNEAYMKVLGKNQRYVPTNGGQVSKLLSHFTLDEIYAYTPSQREVFESCKIRHFAAYLLTPYTGKECNDLFDISKFYTQQYMCYKFSIRAKETYNTEHVSRSIESPSILYTINLSKKFTDMAMFKAIVHEHDSFPARSMMFAGSTMRQRDKKQFHSVLYDLTYSVVRTHNLPSPYKTNCFNYRESGYRNALQCKDLCMSNRTVRHFRKIPFTVIEKLPSPYRHISPFDLSNSLTNLQLRKFEFDCRRSCARADCKIAYSITNVEKMYHEQDITFVTHAPRSPDIKVTFNPAMRFVELVSYCMSLCGAWLGLGALSVRPSSFFRTMKHVILPQAAVHPTNCNCSVHRQSVEKVESRLKKIKNRVNALEGISRRRYSNYY
ncbi:hypothetical protein HDE_04079 [Halotydeus destructor]|nr:hypothetical protein HDE_04079 [Halotydeus destructor]